MQSPGGCGLDENHVRALSHAIEKAFEQGAPLFIYKIPEELTNTHRDAYIFEYYMSYLDDYRIIRSGYTLCIINPNLKGIVETDEFYEDN